MSKSIELSPGALTLAQLRQIWQEPTVLTLPPEAIGAMDASSAIVAKIIREGNPAYGINTGFGTLAEVRIDKSYAGKTPLAPIPAGGRK